MCWINLYITVRNETLAIAAVHQKELHLHWRAAGEMRLRARNSCVVLSYVASLASDGYKHMPCKTRGTTVTCPHRLACLTPNIEAVRSQSKLSQAPSAKLSSLRLQRGLKAGFIWPEQYSSRLERACKGTIRLGDGRIVEVMEVVGVEEVVYCPSANCSYTILNNGIVFRVALASWIIGDGMGRIRMEQGLSRPGLGLPFDAVVQPYTRKRCCRPLSPPPTMFMSSRPTFAPSHLTPWLGPPDAAVPSCPLRPRLFGPRSWIPRRPPHARKNPSGRKLPLSILLYFR